jgi:hypothetical protein
VFSVGLQKRFQRKIFFVDVVDLTKSTYNVYRKKNWAENIIVGPVDATEKPRMSTKIVCGEGAREGSVQQELRVR